MARQCFYCGRVLGPKEKCDCRSRMESRTNAGATAQSGGAEATAQDKTAESATRQSTARPKKEQKTPRREREKTTRPQRDKARSRAPGSGKFNPMSLRTGLQQLLQKLIFLFVQPLESITRMSSAKPTSSLIALGVAALIATFSFTLAGLGRPANRIFVNLLGFSVGSFGGFFLLLAKLLLLLFVGRAIRTLALYLSLRRRRPMHKDDLARLIGLQFPGLVCLTLSLIIGLAAAAASIHQVAALALVGMVLSFWADYKSLQQHFNLDSNSTIKMLSFAILFQLLVLGALQMFILPPNILISLPGGDDLPHA